MEYGNENILELGELVYTPLRAVSEANRELGAGVVDLLKSAGHLAADSSGKPMVHLKTVQLLYDRIGRDETDNPVRECVSLDVPLLSLLPLGGLQVSKTKVSFGAEVVGAEDDGEETKIYAKVCPQNHWDESYQPNFRYEIELDSAPAAETLSRIVDSLGVRTAPKTLHSIPVDENGSVLTDSNFQCRKDVCALRQKERLLLAKLHTLQEAYASKNSALKLRTGMDYEEHSSADSAEDDGSCEALENTRQKIQYLEKELAAVRDEIGNILAGDCEDKDEKPVPCSRYRKEIEGSRIDAHTSGTGTFEETKPAPENPQYSAEIEYGSDEPEFSESMEEDYNLPDTQNAEDEEDGMPVCRPDLVPEYCISKKCLFLSECDFAQEAMENKAKTQNRR